MLLYILKRVAMTVPVMGIVALFVFLLLRLAPGDPAAVIAGDYATAEDVARIREQPLSLCNLESGCGHSCKVTWAFPFFRTNL